MIFHRHNENVPRLPHNCHLVGEQNFNFTEDIYKKIQMCVIGNPGHTLSEYVTLMDFYPFTEKSLEVAFLLFNTWPNTYYGICGPFECKNNFWFPLYSELNTTALAQENSLLRQKVEELQKKLIEKEEQKTYQLENKKI